jgi:hypothetical protein
LNQNPVKISFRIPITEEFKTFDTGKNTIRIRGVALKGDVVSKNNRLYVARELSKACNTFINKPVNINHNDGEKVGHIVYMDYDNDLLTYEAVITKQPYVNLLRNRSATVRGVSIQADYLFNKCVKCGSKFYSEESYHTHMWNEHFIKPEYSSAPHGIIGNGLALVLSPEEPGYVGTSVELAEVARVQTLKLLETVISEEKEKEKNLLKENLNGKAVLTPPTSMTIYSVTEQAPNNLPVDEPEKPKEEDEEPVEEETEKPKTEPEEEEKPVEEETGELEKPKEQEQKEEEEEEEDKPVFEVKKPTLKPLTLSAQETPQPTTQVIAEGLKLDKLHTQELAAPSFEVYVQKGGDPEEYARLYKQVQETNRNNKSLSEAVNKIIEYTSKPISLSLPVIDESWRTQNQQLKEAYDYLQSELAKLPEQVNISLKQLSEAINRVPRDDVSWRRELQKAHEKLGKLEGALSESNSKNAVLTKQLTELNEVLGTNTAKLTTQLAELKQTQETQDKKYADLIAAADKNVKEYIEANNKKLEEKDGEITKLKETLEEQKKKTLQEKQDLTTRVDNLEEVALKPNFKSKSTQVQETKPKDAPYIITPDKGAN